jgi:hypothetical protein
VTWAPDYATPQELLSYLRINASEDTENVSTFAALWVTTASRNVDNHCGRQFGQVAAPEARIYTSVWDKHLCCYVTEIDDLMDLTGFALADSNGEAVTDYEFGPDNALLKGKPYERLLTSVCGKLTATGRWGWDQAAAGPKVAKMGLFLQAARLAARRDSPFGISGSPQEQGEIRLLAALDPDFKVSLKPFRRDWWAA